MGDVAIKAHSLGKQYEIGERQRYKALRDTLTGVIYAPLRKVHSLFAGLDHNRGAKKTIWALKDVSFEINQGEIVGVIGRNGAGKSTLIRILSRITQPTEGYVDILGRVGSLLEVGTGFHPELTGRENIYLNGSIIGMQKREIDSKFDAIVAFAEIDQFLDTAVKYYSSGMYMRLAFAVAAHLEPEILLVDEVLAVGDVEFQKKCMGKMGQVAKEGRTVLFVSHNMAAIRSLCRNAYVFDSGRIVHHGPSDDCVSSYLNWHAYSCDSTVQFAESAGKDPRMTKATFLTDGIASTRAFMGSHLALQVAFETSMPLKVPRLGFVINSADGQPLISANNRYQESPQYRAPVRAGTITCNLGQVPLMPGRYSVTFYLGDAPQHDTHVVEHALWFEVIEKDLWGTGQSPEPEVSMLWWPTEFSFNTSHVEFIVEKTPIDN